ncbi:hypothetical protein NM688_g9102 [Phlebia brevispora]|uniref:Uncharacterized protein n=1 Tax=Phlebia brevispora TaxID=194682 RepID=A0ACC1RKT6_9APHY|nr:hypothetical protein NM688_g9102 [Phlebia brevispora]
MEIRLEGLTVLRDVIEIFAESPDPDFEGALLLEQYQAPITAALTPAFSADSTPEILASAIKACAVFVGSGIVKDVNRMGRILKILTSALEQCQKSGLLQLGDAGEQGPNASVMLRIATLSAWAELEISAETQEYLIKVVEPYRKALASLWISSLRDYASIRVGTELLDDSSSGAVDSSYSSLGKEVLLPYYRDSWSVILQAVTSAMEAGDPSVRIALDGGDPLTADAPTTNGDTIVEHPAAFFFVIFGLVFEALATSTPDIGVQNTRKTIIALKALKCLVHNQYAGNAFHDVPIFEELVNLFYRMALTEPVAVQIHLAETLASLAASMSKSQSNGLTQDSSPLQIHCLRICAYILKRVISSPRENTMHDTPPIEKVKLINTAFDSFMTIASACDPTRNLEYRIVAITLYNELLKDELSEADFVGPTLQSLKKLLESPPASASIAGNTRYEKMIHAILSACMVNIDAMGGREGPACAKKIKSNLLAAVLILTVVPTSLIEPDDMSVIAAHCAKTLVMASTSGNVVLHQAAKLLLPGMIECVAKLAVMDDDASYERRSQIIGEIWKAFSALFMSTAEELRPRVLAVLLPTMTMLLEPAATPPPALHMQTIAQILTFATSSPLAFKEATMKLNAETRETLETSVRQALGGNKNAANDAHKPQISLRSF